MKSKNWKSRRKVGIPTSSSRGNEASGLKTVIIGLGGMGKRWAQTVSMNDASQLSGVFDVDVKKTEAFAAEMRCRAYGSAEEAFADADVDAVVVATPHVFLAPLAEKVLNAGKHVFCEKPGGIASAEVQRCAMFAKQKNIQYRINYNIRLHPAVAEAKRKVAAGEIGKILFIRGVYAHGGREGYEKEWWCNPRLSGGGALIGQGCHLVDLANWFMGPFMNIKAFLETNYWNMPADDNDFLLLRTADGRVASLHASWSHWKKVFRWEVYGDNGYLVVEGLGGQYGIERLIAGEKKLGKEAPHEEMIEFSEEPGKPDTALKNSWKEFLQSIHEGHDVGATPKDAVSVLKVLERAYAVHGGR